MTNIVSEVLAQIGPGFPFPDFCSVIGTIVLSLPLLALAWLGLLVIIRKYNALREITEGDKPSYVRWKQTIRQSIDSPAPKPHWQFSLAGLLKFTTIVAVWLGLVKCFGPLWPFPVMLTLIIGGSFLFDKNTRQISLGLRILLVAVMYFAWLFLARWAFWIMDFR
jgi:hypothetical protein